MPRPEEVIVQYTVIEEELSNSQMKQETKELIAKYFKYAVEHKTDRKRINKNSRMAMKEKPCVSHETRPRDYAGEALMEMNIKYIAECIGHQPTPEEIKKYLPMRKPVIFTFP